jgi:hypothetical protein
VRMKGKGTKIKVRRRKEKMTREGKEIRNK